MKKRTMSSLNQQSLQNLFALYQKLLEEFTQTQMSSQIPSSWRR
ncbi:unnamed protein product [Oikopleura dioica]|uniref:Uncharacterized protein n=1 Tax=Oikopleura dioica TaxID=34765 RepID=E4XEB9_OIKDI|nr:unnamed protein product [Oikopleura dioica]CBY31258.1 unnamed protein product [Oikopleura dioica]